MKPAACQLLMLWVAGLCLVALGLVGDGTASDHLPGFSSGTGTLLDADFLDDLEKGETSTDVVNWNEPTNAISSANRETEVETTRGVLCQSLFGDVDEGWRPLSCGDFFRVGWDEAWAKAPTGSGGALRQGWVNAIDGLFYRTNFAFFSCAFDDHKNGNSFLGDYSIFLPVNRRCQFRLDVPFLSANRSPQGGDYQASFGDVVVSPRFLLSESRDFTQVIAVPIRTPTGSTTTGNGETIFSPQYECWYGGLPEGWAIRGTTGLSIPANNVGGRTRIRYNMAIGKYWQSISPYFVTDLSLNCYSTLDRRGPDYTFVSVTPGARTRLAPELFLLGGIETPLTGPKSANFSWAPIIVVVKNF